MPDTIFDQRTIYHSYLVKKGPLVIQKASNVFTYDEDEPERLFIRVQDDPGFISEKESDDGTSKPHPEGDGEYVLMLEEDDDYVNAWDRVPTDTWVEVHASGNAKRGGAVVDFRDVQTDELLASSHRLPENDQPSDGGGSAPAVVDLPGDSVAAGVWMAVEAARRQVRKLEHEEGIEMDPAVRVTMIGRLAGHNLEAFRMSGGNKPMFRPDGNERPSASSGDGGGAPGKAHRPTPSSDAPSGGDDAGPSDPDLVDAVDEISKLRAGLDLSGAQEDMLDQELEGGINGLQQAKKLLRMLRTAKVRSLMDEASITTKQRNGLQKRLDNGMSVEELGQALSFLEQHTEKAA